MDYEVLKAELIAGHPVTGAYDADASIAAAQINAVNCTEDVESVTGQDIFEAVVPAEYTALSDAHKTLLGMILSLGTILVNGTNTKTALLDMFGGGTITRTNLAALQKRDVSRAGELGLGFVYPGHIENARM